MGLTNDIFFVMILSATLSKPTKQVQEILGKNYERVKIRFKGGSEKAYYAEFFTEKQSFHQNFSEEELEEFLKKNIGLSFKNCVERTEEKEITFLTNKKGKTSRLEKNISSTDKGAFVKPLSAKAAANNFSNHSSASRVKNYIIKEGTSVPFLQALGVMTDSGKVVASKADKFRQVNRFLELVNDVIPEILRQKNAAGDKEPLQILDFGSGKSYLTFAVQYLLENVKKIPCQIVGVDLKEDVVKTCSDLAQGLKIQNLKFVCGDIAEYSGKNPDLVISLHACDIATDYALNFAVLRKAKAILSVPCCQREINSQLSKNSNQTFSSLLKYGIFRERFSALLTDAVRAELLEKAGYKVQVLEFIDMEGTPKNLMIRGTLNVSASETEKKDLPLPSLLETFGVKQKLFDLFCQEKI